jgi:uncharacterized protein (DUF488 family)
MGQRAFFTIGHSTRPIDDFVALLREATVDCVVDVRKMPRSRTNPQYNQETVAESLASAGIDYRHVAALGGLRSRRGKDVASSNTFWQNASFRNYADYAATAASFRDGLSELIALGQQRTCALMCAEAVWWRCHRRIIADYLLSEGYAVFHILGPQRIEPARLTPAAHRETGGALIYAAGPDAGSAPRP